MVTLGISLIASIAKSVYFMPNLIRFKLQPGDQVILWLQD